MLAAPACQYMPLASNFALAEPPGTPLPSVLLTKPLSHGGPTLTRRSLPVAAALTAPPALLPRARGSRGDESNYEARHSGTRPTDVQSSVEQTSGLA